MFEWRVGEMEDSKIIQNWSCLMGKYQEWKSYSGLVPHFFCHTQELKDKNHQHAENAKCTKVLDITLFDVVT